MKTVNKVLVTLLSIGGILLMLWFILPSVHYSITYVPIALCSAAITVVAFFSQKGNQHRFVFIFLPCLLLSLLYYIVPYNLEFKPALNIFQQLVMFTAPAMFLTFIMGLELRNSDYAKLRKILTVICTGLIVFVFVLTLRELAISPNVCRALASGERSDELMELRQRNIGGFGFSYTMGIIELLTFYGSITMKDKRRKIVCIILTVVIVMFIIRSQYMTLLILCLVANLLLLLRFVKGVGSKILIIICAMLVLVFADPISSFMSKLFVGSELSDKFYSISGIFNGAGYSSMRTEYVRDCLNSFADNILLGKFNLINDVEASRISKMSHSTQLKILVDTGLVGITLYNAYILYMRYYIVKQLRTANRNPEPFNMCFWFVWALSWLNPVFQNYELPFALFLIVPLVICYSDRTKLPVKPQKTADSHGEEE